MKNKFTETILQKDRSLKLSTYQIIRDKFRYRLVLQAIRNKVSRFGLDIRLYYWVIEGLFEADEPAIKGDIEKIEIGFLSFEDMVEISKNARGYSAEEMIAWLNKGKKCLGLKYDNVIVSFLWINLKECTFDPKIRRDFKENECYLSDMYTVETFRGRNLATFLRHKSYKILKDMGRTRIYSVSEFFNKSAIRYKQKLKAINLKLIFHIRLFNKISTSIVLRTYEKPTGIM